uniref:Ovule protein n=1 Tax=Meloidogyne incognita TaxID=6306 RepID=A0A914LJA4_MELIC
MTSFSQKSSVKATYSRCFLQNISPIYTYITLPICKRKRQEFRPSVRHRYCNLMTVIAKRLRSQT